MPKRTTPAGGSRANGLSIWGKGFYRDLSIEDEVPFDGTIRGAAIGLDFLVRDDMLLGLSVNRATAEMDWQLPARDFTGQHETEVTGFHPYFAWSPGEGRYVWATLGRYSGDITITEDRQAEAEIKQDADIMNYAVGTRYHFWRSGSTPSLSMSLIGDLSSTTAEATSENSAEVSSTRVRVGIDLDHTGRLAAAEGADSTIDSGFELTWRQDLGDGLKGGGLEAGGGLAINVPNYGLRLDLNARFLLIHSVDAEEWAIDGGLSWAQSPDGRGLSLQFSPQWGTTTTSTRNHLWGGLTGDSAFGGYGVYGSGYGGGYGAGYGSSYGIGGYSHGGAGNYSKAARGTGDYAGAASYQAGAASAAGTSKADRHGSIAGPGTYSPYQATGRGPYTSGYNPQAAAYGTSRYSLQLNYGLPVLNRQELLNFHLRSTSHQQGDSSAFGLSFTRGYLSTGIEAIRLPRAGESTEHRGFLRYYRPFNL